MTAERPIREYDRLAQTLAPSRMSLNCCRQLGRSRDYRRRHVGGKREPHLPRLAGRAEAGVLSAPLATPAAYRSDKALVWGWYRWRTALVERAEPNARHRAIAVLEDLKPGLVVVTQNVDALHERAGSRDVIHLHGSLFSLRCFACQRAFTGAPSAVADTPQPAIRVEPPKCLRCGGPVRPGVVWFGEQLPEQAWGRAERLMEDCDVLLVVGTSGVVQPAASLPRSAKQRGVPLIEVNPEASAIEPVADKFTEPRLPTRFQGSPLRW